MDEQDQAAIDHVASVSKHPHAAMIVKWLITGWDVRRKSPEGWNEERFPGWLPGCEYELIEPKPAKPAYRVYADRDGDLFVAERDSKGGICQTFTEGCRWISEDWIEYQKWPTPLVERIAAIDIKAAEWIVDNWDELLVGKYDPIGLYKAYSDRLSGMFYWPSTEQGDAYWRNISEQLGE